ncbi:FERM domain-containing protein 8-like [Penaeus monodon]|uniref:FERM domain-containing protein 8-like n=1 Tax=Penaeus monodon TaxID=6687 RepID=UPI0018A78417|nr:FERM domain-containing protein 8-like [Penaeus monodon]
MDDDLSSLEDSLEGTNLSRLSRRSSSSISRLSRCESNGSSDSSNINIDDLSLLSESFPARLWHHWIGLPMPLRKMSDYGFEEESGGGGGLGGHQTDAGQNYITVIPVEYPARRPYGDYDAFPRSATISRTRRRPRGETDAFPRSATISREFLRERADFLRGDYKGSADHLDKAAGFYPSLPPPAFDVPPLSLDPETRRPSAHLMTTPAQTSVASMPVHSMPTTTSVTHPSVPQTTAAHHDDLDNKSNKNDHERKSKGMVEVCVFLHSRVAVRLRLEDGAKITAQELQAMVIEEEDVTLPKQAMEVFAIWMVSPVLEIQLKPYQRALEIRRQWGELLKRFTQVPVRAQDARYAYEPKMVLRRNIFFSKRDEVKIRDPKILELLYEEAQWNMRSARYPCELSDYEMLAGIQGRLELGPYDHTTHTPSFFRRRLLDYLPEHACRLKFSDLISFSSKSTPEIRIIEQFRSIPSNVTARKLVRKYLEFSWSLPYYGSAFFHGQIEQPTRGVSSWLPRPDLPVLVTINGTGVSVIEPKKSTVLLSLRYDELSWDYARPSHERNPHCLPCLFLQFAVVENGRRFSKLLQIFSKQVGIYTFFFFFFFGKSLRQQIDATNIKPSRAIFKRHTAGYPHPWIKSTIYQMNVLVPLSTVSRKDVPDSILSNKLHRLSLSTFTEDGRCVGTMGSWQFGR